MAAGSHLEKGICALLVIAARIIKMNTVCSSLVAFIVEKDQRLRFNNIAINRRMKESPMRLDRAVNMPPAKAVGDW